MDREMLAAEHWERVKSAPAVPGMEEFKAAFKKGVDGSTQIKGSRPLKAKELRVISQDGIKFWRYPTAYFGDPSMINCLLDILPGVIFVPRSQLDDVLQDLNEARPTYGVVVVMEAPFKCRPVAPSPRQAGMALRIAAALEQVPLRGRPWFDYVLLSTVGFAEGLLGVWGGRIKGAVVEAEEVSPWGPVEEQWGESDPKKIAEVAKKVEDVEAEARALKQRKKAPVQEEPEPEYFDEEDTDDPKVAKRFEAFDDTNNLGVQEHVINRMFAGAPVGVDLIYYSRNGHEIPGLEHKQICDRFLVHTQAEVGRGKDPMSLLEQFIGLATTLQRATPDYSPAFQQFWDGIIDDYEKKQGA